MSILSTTILAFSMSADAFAASIAKGTNMQRPRVRDAVGIGFVFGAVETVTPIIGWLIGLSASQMIAAYDHWIAFTILGLVGAKMLVESMSEKSEEEPQNNQRLWMLILIAIGTSIDAMAVGVTFAVLDVSIWTPALAIGAATFLMASLGVMTGHYVGQKGGRAAEALGGVALITIGTLILLEHLGLFA